MHLISNAQPTERARASPPPRAKGGGGSGAGTWQDAHASLEAGLAARTKSLGTAESVGASWDTPPAFPPPASPGTRGTAAAPAPPASAPQRPLPASPVTPMPAVTAVTKPEEGGASSRPQRPLPFPPHPRALGKGGAISGGVPPADVAPGSAGAADTRAAGSEREASGRAGAAGESVCVVAAV